MKVENMTSNKGNSVPNQFVISGCPIETIEINGNFAGSGEMFQSYDSNIVYKTGMNKVYLDSTYWDYSVTTGKYRNQFLGETKKETQAKIDSGEYILTNLNG